MFRVYDNRVHGNVRQVASAIAPGLTGIRRSEDMASVKRRATRPDNTFRTAKYDDVADEVVARTIQLRDAGVFPASAGAIDPNESSAYCSEKYRVRAHDAYGRSLLAGCCVKIDFVPLVAAIGRNEKRHAGLRHDLPYDIHRWVKKRVIVVWRRRRNIPPLERIRTGCRRAFDGHPVVRMVAEVVRIVGTAVAPVALGNLLPCSVDWIAQRPVVLRPPNEPAIFAFAVNNELEFGNTQARI